MHGRHRGQRLFPSGYLQPVVSDLPQQRVQTYAGQVPSATGGAALHVPHSRDELLRPRRGVGAQLQLINLMELFHFGLLRVSDLSPGR